MRYETISGEELKVRNEEAWKIEYGGPWADKWASCLYDNENNRVVWVDSGDCPEDMYLGRSLDVFVDIMNAQAEKIQELERLYRDALWKDG